MNFNQKMKRHVAAQTGSTLIGVALLTLVMGFLMTGGIYLLNTYDAVQTDIKSSEKTADLQAALRNFIDIHKRYPCPAPMDVAPDAPGFGMEDCTITDVSGRDGLGVKIGAAPVRTLNVPDSLIVDGFGRRHIYAVTTDLTADDGSADVRNGLGAITIMHKLGDYEETLSNYEGYITYLLMSPGSDDRGAYDINGEEILPCETGTIAGENCDMSDATFYTTVTQSVGDSTDFTHNFAFAANTPAHYWYTGPWSECGTQNSGAKWSGQNRGGVTAARPECFSSYQERVVECRDKQGTSVSDSNCNHTERPVTFRACAIGKCRWSTEPAICTYSPGGCGNGLIEYGRRICLDYQGSKLPNNSACERYASQINARPSVPQRNCPQRCCIETHYDYDGTVLYTTPKVYGSCVDTYADPPPPSDPPPSDPPPSDPPPSDPPPSDPPPSDPPPSDPPPSDPDPSCSYYSQVIDSKNEVTDCPSGQQGQISKWFEKFETRQTDCSTSVSGWQLVQTDNSCKDIPKKGCPSEMVIWSGIGGKSGICSATISSASHGQTRTATKTTGNTGSAIYKCNDGTWERQGMGTCVHDQD